MAVRPARVALKKWLEGEGRTQGVLAEAVDVTQQTISAVLTGREPSEDLARLLEEATGIDWRGWYTSAELRRRGEARERRISRARALRSASA